MHTYSTSILDLMLLLSINTAVVLQDHTPIHIEPASKKHHTETLAGKHTPTKHHSEHHRSLPGSDKTDRHSDKIDRHSDKTDRQSDQTDRQETTPGADGLHVDNTGDMVQNNVKESESEYVIARSPCLDRLFLAIDCEYDVVHRKIALYIHTKCLKIALYTHTKHSKIALF
jgi:hypothetical protein